MEDYKRSSHAVWDFKYHLVWTTKHRYQVLAGDVGQGRRELLREVARSQEMVIYAGSINRDHVHMLIGNPAAYIRVPGGAVHEGEKFAQAVKRTCGITKAVLGSTPVRAGLLGSRERQRDR
jgi:hypothetical protein